MCLPALSRCVLWVTLGTLLLLVGCVRANCPPQCSTCLRTVISCRINGLPAIPTQLQQGTESISLIGQYIFQGILSPANFSALAFPRYSIRSLEIRSSSVQELQPHTFSSLTKLRVLDLSENQRLAVSRSAFSGLELDRLSLNEIGKLMLASDCLQGLRVANLSLRNSRLQSLDFAVFEPVVTSLKRLWLEQNQIRTIDRQFEPLFYRLELVSLRENPLICYCPLLWLSKTLRTKAASSSSNKNNDLFPSCVAPSYLRKRRLHQILETEFNCFVPQIGQIDIDLRTLYSGQLSCHLRPDDRASSSSGGGDQKIPTRIFWLDDSGASEISSKNTAGDMQPVDTRDPNTAVYGFDYSANRDVVRQLKCVAENTAGQNTVSVQVSWAKSPGARPSTLGPQLDGSNSKEQRKQQKLEDGKQVHITATASGNGSDSYLFHKQYTLLEMSAAIVGTFVLTVLLFVVFYKLYFRRRQGYKSGKKSIHYSLHHSQPQQQLTPQQLPIDNGTAVNGSLTTTSLKKPLFNFQHHAAHHPLRGTAGGGFGVYEGSTHYSDNSQTYDSISPSVFAQQEQQQLQQQQQNNPFPSISYSPSAHFIDYKTHRNLYPSNPPNS